MIKITLQIDSIARLCNGFEQANEMAETIFKTGRFSDVSYHVQDGSFTWSGRIDLEPASFHNTHRDQIITWHLRTMCTNIAKCDKVWMFKPGMMNAAKNDCIEMLSILPPSKN